MTCQASNSDGLGKDAASSMEVSTHGTCQASNSDGLGKDAASSMEVSTHRAIFGK